MHDHGHGHEHSGAHEHGDAHGHGPGHAHAHAHGGSSHVHLHEHGHAHGGAHEHGDAAAGHGDSHGHSHAHGGDSHEHVHAHAGGHEQAAPDHAHGGPDHSHGGQAHSHGHDGHDHSHGHGGHDHGHGAPGAHATGSGGGGGCAALAGIVAVVVLALAFASDRQGGGAATRSGALTLTLSSGERLEGWSIEDRDAAVIVAHKGEQELLIPREKLREVSRGTAPRSAPEPAHAAPRHQPASPRQDAADAAPEQGGVLVLLTGRVIVGRVEQQGQTLVVRWPYKDVTWSGEMRIPLADVRWYDLHHDRPTADYYRRFPHERIDPGYEQGTEQHQQQELDERALRLEAQAARLNAHWEDAARLWGELEQRWPAADKRRQLVDCACALFREQGGLDPNVALTNLDRVLRPLTGRPEALGDMADCFERLANAALDGNQLPLAAHMAGRLRALGPDFGPRADRIDERGLALERALRGELHEGHEHDTPREPQHAVPPPPNGPPEIELPR